MQKMSFFLFSSSWAVVFLRRFISSFPHSLRWLVDISFRYRKILQLFFIHFFFFSFVELWNVKWNRRHIARASSRGCRLVDFFSSSRRSVRAGQRTLINDEQMRTTWIEIKQHTGERESNRAGARVIDLLWIKLCKSRLLRGADLGVSWIANSLLNQ